MKIDKNKIKKILVIKFGGIGDILLSTPVLPNLRAYFPNATINFLSLRHSRDILDENPYISRVLTYDPDEDSSWCLIKNIRKQKYDLVIDLYGNPRTALITFLSRAKYRFGFDFRGRQYAYNIMRKGRGGEVHNVQFNLDALETLGIPIVSKALYIPINVVHRDFADEFFRSNNLYAKPAIGITLTGGWEAKRYKQDDYIELIKIINNIYDVNFVLLWGNQKEKEEADYIHSKVPANTFVIPESAIRYVAALIEKCALIVGNDSGPLHLAAAVGTPVLGIYGPTNPKLAGPFGDKNLSIVKEELECLYCNLLECPIGNICMTQLSKDLIVDKINQLIDINKIQMKPVNQLAK